MHKQCIHIGLVTGKSNSFVKLWILIGCVDVCMCWHVCLFFHTFMFVANLYFVISKIIQIICECALNFHIFVLCVLYVSFSSIFFICGFYINSQFLYLLGYVLQLLNRHVVCRFRAILYVIFFFVALLNCVELWAIQKRSVRIRWHVRVKG